MARLEEQMVRQQEVLYNVDFQLVQMERRVARAAGERTQDETAALNARIEALSQVSGTISSSLLASDVAQSYVAPHGTTKHGQVAFGQSPRPHV